MMPFSDPADAKFDAAVSAELGAAAASPFVERLKRLSPFADPWRRSSATLLRSLRLSRDAVLRSPAGAAALLRKLEEFEGAVGEEHFWTVATALADRPAALVALVALVAPVAPESSEPESSEPESSEEEEGSDADAPPASARAFVPARAEAGRRRLAPGPGPGPPPRRSPAAQAPRFGSPESSAERSESDVDLGWASASSGAEKGRPGSAPAEATAATAAARGLGGAEYYSDTGETFISSD
jgi:hypothetical protein